MNSNQPIPINTTITEAPQLQTVIQDGLSPITTIVNAPWISVTSVNGKTEDVDTWPIGSVYMSTTENTAQKVKDALGVGTWTQLTGNLGLSKTVYVWERTA